MTSSITGFQSLLWETLSVYDQIVTKTGNGEEMDIKQTICTCISI